MILPAYQYGPGSQSGQTYNGAKRLMSSVPSSWFHRGRSSPGTGYADPQARRNVRSARPRGDGAARRITVERCFEQRIKPSAPVLHNNVPALVRMNNADDRIRREQSAAERLETIATTNAGRTNLSNDRGSTRPRPRSMFHTLHEIRDVDAGHHRDACLRATRCSRLSDVLDHSSHPSSRSCSRRSSGIRTTPLSQD